MSLGSKIRRIFRLQIEIPAHIDVVRDIQRRIIIIECVSIFRL